MNEIKFTKDASEKYNYMLDSLIRNKVDEFLEGLKDEKFDLSEIDKIYENKTKGYDFYLKRINHVRLVLSKTNSGWIVLDFMTPSEFMKVFYAHENCV